MEHATSQGVRDSADDGMGASASGDLAEAAGSVPHAPDAGRDGVISPRTAPAPEGDKPEGPTREPACWSRPSRAVLGIVALLLVTAAIVHIGFVFLTISPANAASKQLGRSVDAYVYPEFGQDWKLFAPNPMQEEVAVGVRLRTVDSDGNVHTWGWTNLTAQDIASLRHNPVPSHTDQNMLRRSWDLYTDTHDGREENTAGFRGNLYAEYLKRIALQRLGRTAHRQRITEIQFASRTTLVAAPSWTREVPPDITTYRVLPWWPVNDQDYRGL